MSFTPGPWEMVAETEESDGAMVLGAAPHVGPNTKQYVAYHMTDEDARLISAAPELLEVCKLLAYLEQNDVHDDDPRWQIARSSMREAIDKAEGRIYAKEKVPA